MLHFKKAFGYIKDNPFVTQRVVEIELPPWQVVFGPTKRRKVNQHWWRSENKSSCVLEQQLTSWVCIPSPSDGGSKLVVSRWCRWDARFVCLALRSNGWWANLMGGCWSSMVGSVGMGKRAIWRPNWNSCRRGHKPSGKGKRRWSFLILAVASKQGADISSAYS